MSCAIKGVFFTKKPIPERKFGSAFLLHKILTKMKVTAACKPYVLPVSVANTRCLFRGPQVSKFEQVSSVGHQMSVAGGSQVLYLGWGGGCSDVQDIIGNGGIGTPPNSMTDRHL